MKKIHNILCVVDPTADSQPAIERAAWLAKNVAAELELFVCIYDEYSGSGPFFDPSVLLLARSELLERQESMLEGLAEPLREQGISVATKVVWDGPLYEGIVRHAMTSGADVVFKDTHHHTAIKRTLLTNTDWNLIRTCPAPLWLVKSRKMQDTPVFMAAIDPTHQHDKPAALDIGLLDVGTALARATSGEIHAFHAYDPTAVFASVSANAYTPTALPYDEIERSMREHHGRRFDELVGDFNISDDRKHLVSGATHKELAAIADQVPVDVVIMGAIARNQWQRLLIGATAERTLEALPCDLLIIKPDWFESPVESRPEEIVA